MTLSSLLTCTRVKLIWSGSTQLFISQMSELLASSWKSDMFVYVQKNLGRWEKPNLTCSRDMIYYILFILSYSHQLSYFPFLLFFLLSVCYRLPSSEYLRMNISLMCTHSASIFFGALYLTDRPSERTQQTFRVQSVLKWYVTCAYMMSWLFI